MKMCKADHLIASGEAVIDIPPKFSTRNLGEENAAAKLTEIAVRDIRGPSNHMTNPELGRKWSVHPQTIWSCRHFKTWKEVV